MSLAFWAKRNNEIASKKSECSGPYRKPTQVVEESILRRSSDSWLRNSAKWPRNFGRRGAPFGGPQLKGPGDCLSKAQDSAKSKDEV